MRLNDRRRTIRGVSYGRPQPRQVFHLSSDEDKTRSACGEGEPGRTASGRPICRRCLERVQAK